MKNIIYIIVIILVLIIILLTINNFCFNKISNFETKTNNDSQNIPKIIYQTWFTKTIPDNILYFRKKILNLNPDYKYYLYDDNDMENFVKNNYDQLTYNNFKKLKVPTAKADFWRYLILYKNGGIYLDMDSTIDINLNDLINNYDDAIISKEKNKGQFIQWCLIFNKNHPILKETINLVNYNINNNLFTDDILNLTGPGVFTKALQNVHYKNYNEKLNWNDKSYNKFYNKNGFNYRIFGFDFNNKLTFKNNKLDKLLNKQKKEHKLRYWKQERQFLN